ncbi:MAG: hypothetical protein ACM3KD_01060 [Hyphomicrobiaceae bacterium]
MLDENPCATCADVCCMEAFCRESITSDFLRFLLGPQVGGYDSAAGWYVAGSGCRLGHGRPLVCYEYFCEKFKTPQADSLRQLSRALKTVYAKALAGQHILVVEDIGRIGAARLRAIHDRLEALRALADAALRHALGERLGVRSAKPIRDGREQA